MPDVLPPVLLVRLDAIGDALALTPLLAAFRMHRIPVDIVLSERNADIFTPRAYRRRLRADDVMQSDYSYALVATEDAEGYRIARRSGARVRIGFDNGWGKPFKTLWVRSLLTKTIHRTAGLDGRAPHECEVLFQLGSDMFSRHVTPTKNRNLLRPLIVGNPEEHDRRIVFQVTDKWERLGIAFPDVLSCARRLVGWSLDASNVRFIASIHEEIYADAFEQELGLPVERFVALGPWKNVIANARALVAPDSGAIHVAGMVGTPTVDVFPPMRNLSLQTARWAPWAAPYRIIEARADWPKRAIEALENLLGSTAAASK